MLAMVALSGVASAGSLYGTLIVAADGTFLGVCGGKYDALSVSNDYGSYGSKYAAKSMFNPYGLYGGKYSLNSPFNAYGQPPYLLAGTPTLRTLFTSASYRPTPAVLNALKASGATRITVSTVYPGALDPNDLHLACQNP